MDSNNNLKTQQNKRITVYQNSCHAFGQHKAAFTFKDGCSGSQFLLPMKRSCSPRKGFCFEAAAEPAGYINTKQLLLKCSEFRHKDSFFFPEGVVENPRRTRPVPGATKPN